MSKSIVRLLTTAALIALALVWANPAPAAEDAAKPDHAKKHEYHGTITAVDATALTLTVEKKAGDSKIFTCTEKCKYGGKEDKIESLKDYKVGDRVNVHYTADGDKLMCHKMNRPKGPPPAKAQ